MRKSSTVVGHVGHRLCRVLTSSLELLNDPVSTKCDHLYCRFCISDFLKHKAVVPCPLCKSPIIKRSLIDCTRIAALVENVGHLTAAYKQDCGHAFSPPKLLSSRSFFPCTPEPLQTHSRRKKDEKRCQINKRNRKNTRISKKRNPIEAPTIYSEGFDDSEQPLLSTNINIRNGFPVSNAKGKQYEVRDRDDDKSSRAMTSEPVKFPSNPVNKHATRQNKVNSHEAHQDHNRGQQKAISKSAGTTEDLLSYLETGSCGAQLQNDAELQAISVSFQTPEEVLKPRPINMSNMPSQNENQIDIIEQFARSEDRCDTHIGHALSREETISATPLHAMNGQSESSKIKACMVMLSPMKTGVNSSLCGVSWEESSQTGHVHKPATAEEGRGNVTDAGCNTVVSGIMDTSAQNQITGNLSNCLNSFSLQSKKNEKKDQYRNLCDISICFINEKLKSELETDVIRKRKHNKGGDVEITDIITRLHSDMEQDRDGGSLGLQGNGGQDRDGGNPGFQGDGGQDRDHNSLLSGDALWQSERDPSPKAIATRTRGKGHLGPCVDNSTRSKRVRNTDYSTRLSSVGKRRLCCKSIRTYSRSKQKKGNSGGKVTCWLQKLPCQPNVMTPPTLTDMHESILTTPLTMNDNHESNVMTPPTMNDNHDTSLLIKNSMKLHSVGDRRMDHYIPAQYNNKKMQNNGDHSTLTSKGKPFVWEESQSVAGRSDVACEPGELDTERKQDCSVSCVKHSYLKPQQRDIFRSRLSTTDNEAATVQAAPVSHDPYEFKVSQKTSKAKGKKRNKQRLKVKVKKRLDITSEHCQEKDELTKDPEVEITGFDNSSKMSSSKDKVKFTHNNELAAMKTKISQAEDYGLMLCSQDAHDNLSESSHRGDIGPGLDSGVGIDPGLDSGSQTLPDSESSHRGDIGPGLDSCSRTLPDMQSVTGDQQVQGSFISPSTIMATDVYSAGREECLTVDMAQCPLHLGLDNLQLITSKRINNRVLRPKKRKREGDRIDELSIIDSTAEFICATEQSIISTIPNVLGSHNHSFLDSGPPLIPPTPMNAGPCPQACSDPGPSLRPSTPMNAESNPHSIQDAGPSLMNAGSYSHSIQDAEPCLGPPIPFNTGPCQPFLRDTGPSIVPPTPIIMSAHRPVISVIRGSNVSTTASDSGAYKPSVPNSEPSLVPQTPINCDAPEPSLPNSEPSLVPPTPMNCAAPGPSWPNSEPSLVPPTPMDCAAPGPTPVHHDEACDGVSDASTEDLDIVPEASQYALAETELELQHSLNQSCCFEAGMTNLDPKSDMDSNGANQQSVNVIHSMKVTSNTCSAVQNLYNSINKALSSVRFCKEQENLNSLSRDSHQASCLSGSCTQPPDLTLPDTDEHLEEYPFVRVKTCMLLDDASHASRMDSNKNTTVDKSSQVSIESEVAVYDAHEKQANILSDYLDNSSQGSVSILQATDRYNLTEVIKSQCIVGNSFIIVEEACDMRETDAGHMEDEVIVVKSSSRKTFCLDDDSPVKPLSPLSKFSNEECHKISDSGTCIHSITFGSSSSKKIHEVRRMSVDESSACNIPVEEIMNDCAAKSSVSCNLHANKNVVSVFREPIALEVRPSEHSLRCDTQRDERALYTELTEPGAVGYGHIRDDAQPIHAMYGVSVLSTAANESQTRNMPGVPDDLADSTYQGADVLDEGKPMFAEWSDPATNNGFSLHSIPETMIPATEDASGEETTVIPLPKIFNKNLRNSSELCTELMPGTLDVDLNLQPDTNNIIPDSTSCLTVFDCVACSGSIRALDFEETEVQDSHVLVGKSFEQQQTLVVRYDCMTSNNSTTVRDIVVIPPTPDTSSSQRSVGPSSSSTASSQKSVGSSTGSSQSRVGPSSSSTDSSQSRRIGPSSKNRTDGYTASEHEPLPLEHETLFPTKSHIKKIDEFEMSVNVPTHGVCKAEAMEFDNVSDAGCSVRGYCERRCDLTNSAITSPNGQSPHSCKSLYQHENDNAPFSSSLTVTENKILGAACRASKTICHTTHSMFKSNEEISLERDRSQKTYPLSADDDVTNAKDNDAINTSCAEDNDAINTSCAEDNDAINTSCAEDNDAINTSCAEDNDAINTSCAEDNDAINTSCAEDNDVINTSCSEDNEVINTSCAEDNDAINTSCAEDNDVINTSCSEDNEVINTSCAEDNDVINTSCPEDNDVINTCAEDNNVINTSCAEDNDVINTSCAMDNDINTSCDMDNDVINTSCAMDNDVTDALCVMDCKKIIDMENQVTEYAKRTRSFSKLSSCGSVTYRRKKLFLHVPRSSPSDMECIRISTDTGADNISSSPLPDLARNAVHCDTATSSSFSRHQGLAEKNPKVETAECQSFINVSPPGCDSSPGDMVEIVDNVIPDEDEGDDLAEIVGDVIPDDDEVVGCVSDVIPDEVVEIVDNDIPDDDEVVKIVDNDIPDEDKVVEIVGDVIPDDDEVVKTVGDVIPDENEGCDLADIVVAVISDEDEGDGQALRSSYPIPDLILPDIPDSPTLQSEALSSDEDDVVFRPQRRLQIITSDSSDCEDESRPMDNHRVLNLTSSSTYSSQSEVLTTQQREKVATSLAIVQMEIEDLQAKLGREKRAGSDLHPGSADADITSTRCEHGIDAAYQCYADVTASTPCEDGIGAVDQCYVDVTASTQCDDGVVAVTQSYPKEAESEAVNIALNQSASDSTTHQLPLPSQTAVTDNSDNSLRHIKLTSLNGDSQNEYLQCNKVGDFTKANKTTYDRMRERHVLPSFMDDNNVVDGCEGGHCGSNPCADMDCKVSADCIISTIRDSLSSPWYDAGEEASKEGKEPQLTSADQRPSRGVNSPNTDDKDTSKYISCTEGACYDEDTDSDNSDDLFFSPPSLLPATVGACTGESFILCDAAADLTQRSSDSRCNVNKSEYVEKDKHQLLKPSDKENHKGETSLTPRERCVSETSGGDNHILCQGKTSLTPRGCHAAERSRGISDLRSPMFDAGRKFGISEGRTQTPLVMKANEASSRQKNLAFIATGLTGYELRQVQRLAEMYDSKFYKTCNKSVTHVIVKTELPDTLVCERTLKYFQGIASQCWVLAYKWVAGCLAANRFLPEEPFEIEGDTVNGVHHHGPKRSRVSETRLLNEYAIIYQGASTGMTMADLLNLMKLSGSTVEADPESLSSHIGKKCIMLTEMDEEEDPASSQVDVYNLLYATYRIVTLSREWLLDSISQHRIQPLEEYLLNSSQNIELPG